MSTSMEKIRELVDVNTIIGDPVTSPDGTVIIPVSKVSFGFVSGGSAIQHADKLQIVALAVGGRVADMAAQAQELPLSPRPLSLSSVRVM